ncbi:LTA synthase family protein [Vagococcus xieshaowenii]|uniref:LTA synthase family protein n=1 Tax=Vagococcus xieshaowenii TaxID=2562451 RepID=A0AAJ5JKT5_9ENTE|nr:LTA synthase family protein [Vagococcus xieshaowenii]QCA28016.1 LTA synthase family protein [Vagococcus xieshaowenii]TFZ40293.1 LTA synthase family protein [Vagococcus xieshaowenii]
MKWFNYWLDKEEKWLSNWQRFKQKRLVQPIGWIVVLALPFLANYFLQLSQNNWSFDLAYKFAFEWHTDKFLLSCLVLACLLMFMISLLGSVAMGSLFFFVGSLVLGFANYSKMFNRMEPLYPDDLSMINEWGILHDMIGTPLYMGFVLLMLLLAYVLLKTIWNSIKIKKWQQIIRVICLGLSLLGIWYISDFNNPNNLLRKEYDKTAKWIPYSQKMNYYNTGFVAGFLYNLTVEPMEKPAGYSKQAIKEITEKYKVTSASTTNEEKPNIVYVMSESFSDPFRLGIQATKDPLENYRKLANQTYSGLMLSQNYGGGTANIEFEALSSLSMQLMNAQMTTPYTMLVPKKEKFPTLVSRLKQQDYYTTAIHPYNTSMYKRKDVYKVFGFDEFLDENKISNQNKLADNPYISDEAAYQEVYETLQTNQDQANFVHLVTMQTHMPYGKKYPERTIQATGDVNTEGIADYLTDIEYSSQAFIKFLNDLKQVKRRTIVVFWGDHLPALYSDDLQSRVNSVDLHLTEFLMYDTDNRLVNHQKHDAIISPFYFTSTMMGQAGLNQAPIDRMLSKLSKKIPAFEKTNSYQNGVWQEELDLSDQETKELYEDYQMIQYDIVGGNQYSTATGFFE